MKAFKYKIVVSDNAVMLSHGFTRPLMEICVPELGLFINKEHSFIQANSELRLNAGIDKQEIECSDYLAFCFNNLKRELQGKEGWEKEILANISFED